MASFSEMSISTIDSDSQQWNQQNFAHAQMISNTQSMERPKLCCSQCQPLFKQQSEAYFQKVRFIQEIAIIFNHDNNKNLELLSKLQNELLNTKKQLDKKDESFYKKLYQLEIDSYNSQNMIKQLQFKIKVINFEKQLIEKSKQEYKQQLTIYKLQDLKKQSDIRLLQNKFQESNRKNQKLQAKYKQLLKQVQESHGKIRILQAKKNQLHKEVQESHGKIRILQAKKNQLHKEVQESHGKRYQLEKRNIQLTYQKKKLYQKFLTKQYQMKLLNQKFEEQSHKFNQRIAELQKKVSSTQKQCKQKIAAIEMDKMKNNQQILERHAIFNQRFLQFIRRQSQSSKKIQTCKQYIRKLQNAQKLEFNQIKPTEQQKRNNKAKIIRRVSQNKSRPKTKSLKN